mmetsp:Transcript_12730/g.30364  ORF Transcript_12730/g.30364 Transcript_12730/m.30364 type:complete len:85 (+) Transcript_12730:2400-2654(+)
MQGSQPSTNTWIPTRGSSVGSSATVSGGGVVGAKNEAVSFVLFGTGVSIIEVVLVVGSGVVVVEVVVLGGGGVVVVGYIVMLAS